MRATAILSEEHRVIERVLKTLTTAADRLERGGTISPEFLAKATEFIRGYADGWHHRKEEGVLFQEMVEAGLSREEGPIAVMLAEHERARQLTRALDQGAKTLMDDPGAAAGLLATIREYVSLLQEHIRKEDDVLFPMAAEIIPESHRDGILERFEKVEAEGEGVDADQHYLTLVQYLESSSHQ